MNSTLSMPLSSIPASRPDTPPADRAQSSITHDSSKHARTPLRTGVTHAHLTGLSTATRLCPDTQPADRAAQSSIQASITHDSSKHDLFLHPRMNSTLSTPSHGCHSRPFDRSLDCYTFVPDSCLVSWSLTKPLSRPLAAVELTNPATTRPPPSADSVLHHSSQLTPSESDSTMPRPTDHLLSTLAYSSSPIPPSELLDQSLIKLYMEHLLDSAGAFNSSALDFLFFILHVCRDRPDRRSIQASRVSPAGALGDLRQRLEVAFHDSVDEHARLLPRVPRRDVDHVRLHHDGAVLVLLLAVSAARPRVERRDGSVVRQAVVPADDAEADDVALLVQDL
nr:hypothetical protein PHAVU_008G093500g [Ipomoea batatas]GMD50133.1 hypothetical protein PHAVU_008G093500g [Ipomoea batatas]